MPFCLIYHVIADKSQVYGAENTYMYLKHQFCIAEFTGMTTPIHHGLDKLFNRLNQNNAIFAIMTDKYFLL